MVEKHICKDVFLPRPELISGMPTVYTQITKRELIKVLPRPLGRDADNQQYMALAINLEVN